MEASLEQALEYTGAYVVPTYSSDREWHSTLPSSWISLDPRKLTVQTLEGLGGEELLDTTMAPVSNFIEAFLLWMSTSILNYKLFCLFLFFLSTFLG